ncbi:MAG: hypothetical protein HN509_16885 [Halobacteriovoraceae bacterium]|jgi:hypothetical protein|nr:hypothetical protein [Halobacteriovoraceae bacterium]MBT5093066.1 hypothetical protein [Halobacteriovoraceae bacterium]
MKFISTILFTLLLLGSCSQKGGETSKANLVFAGSISGDGGHTGGLMVFGFNRSNGDNFSFLFDGLGITLSNGVWDFYLVGWQGAAGMTGNVNCGAAENFELSGGDVNVPITMSTPNCHHPMFGPAVAKEVSGEPKLLDVNSCFGVEGVVFNDSTLCPQSVGRSYQVFWPNAEGGAAVGGGLTSDCISVAGSAVNPATGSVRFPMLTAGVPMDIISYDAPSCAGSSVTYNAENGFLFTIPALLSVDIGGTNNTMVLSHDPCDFTAGNLATPVQVNVSPETPPLLEVVCNGNQLGAINASPGLNYLLKRNISLAGTTYDDSVVTTIFTGQLLGEGHEIADLTINQTSGTSSIGLFSELDGAEIRDLRIRNFNITTADSADVGALAGRINDSTTGSRLEFLIAHDIFIDSSATSLISGIGGLIGSMTNGTGTTPDSSVSGVFMGNVNINVSDDLFGIGGAIGVMTDNINMPVALRGILIKDLTVTQSEPITSGYGLGGVVGKIIGTNNNAELFGATVKNINMGTAANRLGFPEVGGIVGATDQGRLLFNSASSGSIYTNQIMLGGIVGNCDSSEVDVAISNLTLNSSFAGAGGNVGGIFGTVNTKNTMNLTVTNLFSNSIITCGQNCGGIVGDFTHVGAAPGGGTGITVDHSMFDGELHHNGSAQPSSCMGGIAGALGTGTDSVNLHFDITRSVSSGAIFANQDDIGGVHGCTIGTSLSNIDDVLVSTEIYNAGSADNIGGLLGASGNTNMAGTRNIIVPGNFPSVANSGPGNGAGSGVTFSSTRDDTLPITGTGATSGSATTSVFTFGALSGALSLLASDWGDHPDSFLLSPRFFIDFSQVSLTEVGSFTDPILLYDRDQWNAIGGKPPFMSRSFKLMVDIDFSAGGTVPTNNMNPIGDGANDFLGELLGNDHVLANIHVSDNSGLPVGLFRGLGSNSVNGGARISHFDPTNTVDFEDSFSLTILNGHFEGAGSVGALAGSSTDSGVTNGHQAIELENIHVVNTVVTHTGGGSGSLGGLIGDFSVFNQQTEVSEVSFDGNVFTPETIAGATTGIGGIFGTVIGTPPGGNIRFEILKNFGEIDAEFSENVGGLIGIITNNNVEIQSSENFGSVFGDTDVGGLIGETDAFLSESRSIGNPTFIGEISAETANAGGLVGTITGGAIIRGNYATNVVYAGDFAGAILGNDAAATETIESNWAASPSVTVNTSSDSYFGFNITGGTYNDNFYVSAVNVDEGLGATISVVSSTDLFQPTVMAPLNNAGGSFVITGGDIPRLWWEVFPQFLKHEPY